MFRFEWLACATMVLSMIATVASAQDPQVQPVQTIEKWSVYVHEAGGEKSCFAASVPQRSRNTRNGKSVSVRRGPTQMSVMFRPASATQGEISFTGGYPFDPGRTVKVTVGGESFDLHVDDEWAWTGSEEEDRKLHEAFRRGSTAIVTGVSTRGTTTTDTFSLIGFTGAFSRAKELCS